MLDLFAAKRKKDKHKKKHRKNIDYMVKNFLNEESRTQQLNRERCIDFLGEDNLQTMEECTDLLLRSRRSIIDSSVNVEEEIIKKKPKHKTILTTELKSKNPKRRLRRRHDKNYFSTANQQNIDYCKVKPLYISFHALGWAKWIVAPEGLNVNFCEGLCPFPLTSSLAASNHAVLQSVSNYNYPEKVKPPCCVPHKLARMTILYHQDDRIITMQNYDNMIVETCGCR